MKMNDRLLVARQVTDFVERLRREHISTESTSVEHAVAKRDVGEATGTFETRQILVASEGWISKIGSCILCCRDLAGRIAVSVDALVALYKAFSNKVDELAEEASKIGGDIGGRITVICNTADRLSDDIVANSEIVLFELAPAIEDLLNSIGNADETPQILTILKDLKDMAENIAQNMNKISIDYTKYQPEIQ
jgi:methyl-accepting chemotaxis protein